MAYSGFGACTILAGKRLLGALAAVTAVFVMAVSDGGLRADEVKHKSVVKIAKVDVIPGKKSTTRNTSTIEVNFSLDPNVPKGATILFELRYGFDPDPLAEIRYTLQSEKRNGLKLPWKPKIRLPVGDDYSIKTSIPLAIQKQSVAREIKKREKVFPADSKPWSWYHTDVSVKFGTPADLKAERDDVKKYFRENIASIQDYYYEFVGEMEKLRKGEKYIDGRSVQTKELVAFIEPWMQKYGALQKKLRGRERKQPGFFSKDRAAYLQLELLGQQATKCARGALKTALEKRGSSIGDFKFKGSKDFNANLRGRVKESRLERTYEAINRLIGFDVQEEPGAKPAGKPSEPAGKPKKRAGKASGEKK